MEGRLAAQVASPPADVEAHLLSRIAQQPNAAANWRLLGRLRLARNDIAGALDACGRAVELEPESASAHFDLGSAWLAAREPSKAIHHLQLVSAIAPDSDYARQSAWMLPELYRMTAAEGSPMTADLAPNRFAGTTLVETTRDPRQSLLARVEMGAQYNSNVQLAPVSRVAVSPGLASAQGFLAPQLEYRALRSDCWRAGVGFDGYFNVNEAPHGQFDLQHYQPGAFVERTLPGDAAEGVLRLQYDFTLDEFAGRTFGTRHALTGIATILQADCESIVYWTIDYSDFADDGALPAVSSLDGWTNTVGLSHAVYNDETPLLALLRGGVDLQWAPLQGRDFAYRGVFAYAESESRLPWQTCLQLQVGCGYRDFPDFTSSPARNEALWQAGAELRKRLGEHWEVALFSNYNRFASQNANFDTDRFISGVMTTFRY